MCVDVCPVGNEPMVDIMEMRRAEVLMAAVDYSQLYQEEVVESETQYFEGTPAEIAAQLADKLFEEKVI